MSNQSRRKFLKISTIGLGAAGISGCGIARQTIEDTKNVMVQAGTAQGMSSDTVVGGVPQHINGVYDEGRIRMLGTAPVRPFAIAPIPLVRVGFIGVGGQGTGHVENQLALQGVEVRAICDIDESHAKRASDMVVAKGQRPPKLYTRGPRDFERMMAEEDLDLVLIATPWEWHVPMAMSAMKNGKHVACEVPFAYRVDDCWAIVETAEKYQKHCIMLENCNYDRDELMVLNMVRKGLLGEVLHAECGYLHDLRGIKFSTEGEGMWRRAHAWSRDGNLYPTHGLGPVSNCLNINRGDQYDYLVSMSSPSRGLQDWAAEHYPSGSPYRSEKFALGDVNTTLIKTVNGKTIFLSHDTNLPRPYSRINMVQGTKGIFQGYPSRVYLEGKAKQPHRWDEAKDWYKDYDHPLWKSDGATSNVGHGGMDFFENYRFVKCLQQGLPTDMNVYDAAALSSICELTEISVANGSQPVKIPDFTRGQWRNWEPWGIVS